tara:strand:+ start:25873 stop:26568 length:696 start_codon:yes stop_codon:yes gene_type:complete
MKKNKKSILVVAAHPDDEALGCGGTIAKLTKNGSVVNILFVSNGVDSRGGTKKEIKNNMKIRKKAAIKSCEVLGAKYPTFLDLPDNQLDKFSLLQLTKMIEKFVKKYSPSIVYTHFGEDLNIDHRIVHKAVITACRPQKKCSVKTLFFFEVPSSTEWKINSKRNSFEPNWFEDITSTKKKKYKALKAYFMELKKWPHPRSLKGIKALVRWRGATAGVEAAESFIMGRNISK